MLSRVLAQRRPEDRTNALGQERRLERLVGPSSVQVRDQGLFLTSALLVSGKAERGGTVQARHYVCAFVRPASIFEPLKGCQILLRR